MTYWILWHPTEGFFLAEHRPDELISLDEVIMVKDAIDRLSLN